MYFEQRTVLVFLFLAFGDQELTDIHAVLLGSAESGKSATRNSLLDSRPAVGEDLRLAEVDNTCVTAQTTVVNYRLKIVDPPNLSESDVEEAGVVSRRLQGWFRALGPGTGPHVLLYAVDISRPFTQPDASLLAAVRRAVGRDMGRHVIVVFTHGDELVKKHTTAQAQLQQVSAPLRSLLDECGDRHVVLSNTVSVDMKRVRQSRGLIREMIELTKANRMDVLKLPVTPPPTAAKPERTWQQPPRQPLDSPIETRPRVPERPRSAEQADGEVQIILIGKTGNGKSSFGNLILGQEDAFQVSAGIVSSSQVTRIRESVHPHRNKTLKVQVLDFPDVRSVDERSLQREVELCRSLTYPAPSATCLVLRADVRFTQEEFANYRNTRQLLGEGALHNLVIVFTMADKLPTEGKDTFEKQLRRANPELKQVLKDAQDRYVLVSNEAGDEDSSTLDPKRLGVVARLLDSISTQRAHTSDSKPLRAILVGSAASGKGSIRSSVLSRQQRASRKSMRCDTESAVIAGLKLQMVVIPGISSQVGGHHEDLCREIRRWFATFGSGLHVLLYAMDATKPFSPHDRQLLAALKAVFGKDIVRHVVVVFTRGDLLKDMGTTIQDVLDQSSQGLKDLLAEAEDRFLLFDNNATSLQARLLQRNRLLRAMSGLYEVNRGQTITTTDNQSSVFQAFRRFFRGPPSQRHRGHQHEDGATSSQTVPKESQTRSQCVLS